MKPLLDQGGVFLYPNEGQKIKVWSKTREYLFPFTYFNNVIFLQNDQGHGMRLFLGLVLVFKLK